jgi:hypothetical protein
MSRKRPSEEERAAQHARERRLTCEAVESLKASEGWQRWLAARRHVRRYSVANQLLIAVQRAAAHCSFQGSR